MRVTVSELIASLCFLASLPAASFPPARGKENIEDKNNFQKSYVGLYGRS